MLLELISEAMPERFAVFDCVVVVEAVAVFEALRAGALDTLSAGDARFVRRLLGAIGERLGITAEA